MDDDASAASSAAGPAPRRTAKLESIVAATDQACLEFRAGGSASEIAESLHTNLLTAGKPLDEGFLRGVDALGLVGADVQARLRRCGVRLYNTARALEPASPRVLAVRLLAVRCLEAGGANRESVLLCYVRSGLKYCSLRTAGEMEATVAARHALGCFRRGFALVTFASVLGSKDGDFDEDNEECHNSGELQERNDLAASVFHGAFEMTQLELDDPDADSKVLRFLASMWREAMPVLGSRVRDAFRRRTWDASRRLAMRLYERGTDFDQGLALFEALERSFPTQAFDAEARLDDLIAVADMQVATGNRGIATVTLETARSCRASLASRDEGSTASLTWSALVSSESTRSASDRGPANRLAIQAIKESAVSVKLAVAECQALSGAGQVTEDAAAELDRANGDASKAMDAFVAELGNFNSAEPDLAARTFTLVCLTCETFCNFYGYSSETLRQSFLAAEAAFGEAPSRRRVAMRLSLLDKLPADDADVCALLEDLAGMKLAGSEGVALASRLWRRVVVQLRASDLDGAATSARFLLELAGPDRVACAQAHLVVAEALREKGAWKQVLDHAEQAKAGSSGKLLQRALILCTEAALHDGKLERATRCLQAVVAGSQCSAADIARCAQTASAVGALAQVGQALLALDAAHDNPVWAHHALALALARAGLCPSATAFEEAQRKFSDTEVWDTLGPLLDDLFRSSRFEKSLGTDRNAVNATSRASLYWIQTVTWRLARGCEDLCRSGLLYAACAKASESIASARGGEDGSDSELLRQRVDASATLALCALLDSVLTAIGDTVLDEPGAPATSETEAKLDQALVDRMTWLAELCPADEAELRAATHFVLGKSGPDFHLAGSDKMAQFALLAVRRNDISSAEALLGKALQVEVGRERPSGPRLGRVLVLLVKHASDQTKGVQWVCQARQLGAAHPDLYFTQAARRYLSAWAWNAAVRCWREAEAADAEDEETKGNADGRRRAETLMRESVALLRQSPAKHDDRVKADELEVRISEITKTPNPDA